MPQASRVCAVTNRGPQPIFEALRRDSPFLADATAGYALGDVWGRDVLDARTRQLAAMAAFASLGLRAFFKTHAACRRPGDGRSESPRP